MFDVEPESDLRRGILEASWWNLMADHSNPSEFLTLLQRDGVASGRAELQPMGGGVSSEIYLLRDGDKPLRVVKRALAKLRVSEEWLANVSRNSYERKYLQYVGDFLPEAVPRVLGFSDVGAYFLMEYIDEGDSNWKQRLLGGDAIEADAQRAGQILGTIHKHSVNDRVARQTFDTGINFFELRIDPYLITTGRRNPKLKGLFNEEADRLGQTRQCLVHGDVSPKNILVSPSRMILLDCEVAWFGDPAFDVAFLLNHLFLKSLYHAMRAVVNVAAGGMPAKWRGMIEAFWNSYRAALGDTFDLKDLEVRVVRLLLMLMLARLDGKSPVEYLARQQQDFVRDFVTQRLPDGNFDLQAVSDDWFAEWKPC